MAQYVSEHTKFMRDFMAQHPEELDQQKTGRAMWWDKSAQEVDATRARNEAAGVPQKAYCYQAD